MSTEPRNDAESIAEGIIARALHATCAVHPAIAPERPGPVSDEVAKTWRTELARELTEAGFEPSGGIHVYLVRLAFKLQANGPLRLIPVGGGDTALVRFGLNEVMGARPPEEDDGSS